MNQKRVWLLQPGNYFVPIDANSINFKRLILTLNGVKEYEQKVQDYIYCAGRFKVQWKRRKKIRAHVDNGGGQWWFLRPK